MLPDAADNQMAGPDFWRSSGYHLLNRRLDGRLQVSDAFLQAYLRRPELAPVAESCAAETELHEMLEATPAMAVPEARLAAVSDEAARENYRTFLRFRDLLLTHDTLEAAYSSLFQEGVPGIAPLFIDQLVHAILRGVLEGCTDPFRARAGELLFRTQTVSREGGAVLLADSETIEMRAAQASRSRELLQPPGGLHTHVEMDLMGEANAGTYWRRSDRFDMALDVAFTQPGLDAVCRVLEAWVRHFLAVEVEVQPVQEVRDDRWVWHVGLDAQASSILNALYRGEAVPDGAPTRLLSLFRLTFRDPADMRPDIAGRPVYLAMAADERNRLRLKPQNLLVHLPIAASG